MRIVMQIYSYKSCYSNSHINQIISYVAFLVLENLENGNSTMPYTCSLFFIQDRVNVGKKYNLIDHTEFLIM